MNNRLAAVITFFFFFIVCLVCLTKAVDFDFKDPEPIVYTPVVHTKHGKIRGLVRHSEGTRKVNFYQGIRYGTAKRFEKPVMVEKWEDIYNATHVRYACPQNGIRVDPTVTTWEENDTNTKVSSEDCLFLNIWQPDFAAHHKNLPVMVWIHGGTYKSGTIFSYNYDARHIAAFGEVVVATINYRLGSFGFLGGGSEKYPGNLGLYDMRLALEWVKENIQHFGGSPSQVTVFGESAGGMAVGALVLSPLTKNLFHRAIMQSGAANSYLGSEEKAKSLPKTKTFGERLNCTAEKLDEIIECLQKRNANQLLDAAQHDIENGEEFIPIYHESFLPMSPSEELLKFNRNIDLLFGVTANEGIGFIKSFLPALTDKNGHINLDKLKSAMALMIIMFKLNNSAQVVEFYTKHLNANSSSDEMRDALADAFADFHIVCPTMLFGEAVARQHNTHGKKHHYYSYRLMQPLHFNILGCQSGNGVCHGEDVVYLFGHPINFWNKTIHFDGQTIEVTEEEYRLSKEMIKAWTNFAHRGTMGNMENVAWTPAIDIGGKDKTPKDISVSFMELFAGHFKMTHGFYKESCDKFWRPTLFPEEH